MQQNYAEVEAIPIANDEQSPPVAFGFIPDENSPMMLPRLVGESINQTGVREFLTMNGWPIGLQDSIIRDLLMIPYRFFICDDSASMIESDGHRFIVLENKQIRMVDCSRWQELTESMKFHLELAKIARSPVEFRLLNQRVPEVIGLPEVDDDESYQHLLSGFQESPNGATPLCHHIEQVIERITLLRDALNSRHQKAFVAIFTDGQPSDGEIIDTIKQLRNLPVYISLRLCTDETEVVKYWNDIDTELELNMDVLDDFSREAMEVHKFNPWLTYGEPLHRMREYGTLLKELDYIDEQPLSKESLRRMCTIIYGVTEFTVPDPEQHWYEFLSTINDMNSRVSKIWNTVTKRYADWIDTRELDKKYNKTSCSIL